MGACRCMVEVGTVTACWGCEVLLSVQPLLRHCGCWHGWVLAAALWANRSPPSGESGWVSGRVGARGCRGRRSPTEKGHDEPVP